MAVNADYGSGNIVLLPSLGDQSDEDTEFVLTHFFGFGLKAQKPAWSGRLRVPGQIDAERALEDKNQSLQQITDEVAAAKSELEVSQRWKRLLYDESFGLEEIVKEALELIGATVEKKEIEKAGGFAPGSIICSGRIEHRQRERNWCRSMWSRN